MADLDHSSQSMEFEDNRLAAALFGEHNANLAYIEKSLGVRIKTRGNYITFHGAKTACGKAHQALTWLYDCLQQGFVAEQGDMEALLRHIDKDRGAAAWMRPIKTGGRVILARSPAQAAYIASLRNREMIFGVGDAGTGKTYLAVAIAIEEIQAGNFERLILSRPAVEAGERLGFLPGDMRDKVDPYLRPLYDALHDILPNGQITKKMASGAIEIAPLAFMRGRTLENAFIILDEAQNCTKAQLKMFLTRMGAGSRMVVTGDPGQVDLPKDVASGLHDILPKLPQINDIVIIRFGREDTMRHSLVRKILRLYDQENDHT